MAPSLNPLRWLSESIQVRRARAEVEWTEAKLRLETARAQTRMLEGAVRYGYGAGEYIDHTDRYRDPDGIYWGSVGEVADRKPDGANWPLVQTLADLADVR